MKKLLITASMPLVLLVMAPALAQDQDAGASEQTAAEDGASAEEQTEGDVTKLMSNVGSLAESLQGTVDSLAGSLERSANSEEEGLKMIDDMLAAAEQVNSNLGRDSEIWTELNNLMESWKAKRDKLQEAGQENERLLEIAEMWQARIDDATELRTQILDQASESEVMVEQIRDRREVIVALYEIEAADQVLANMRQVSDQLGQMNDNMTQILDQAGRVAGSEQDAETIGSN
jgi:chromosome segregation ATPase